MRRAIFAHDVTPLLRGWSRGDAQVLNRLVGFVYRNVHRIAHLCMAREYPIQTVQPTALINEAYLSPVDVQHVRWQDRAHFFAPCARAMRRFLVDHARSRATLKRGAGQVCVELDPGRGTGKSANLLELDQALNRVAGLDAGKSQVLELRLFGGLSEVETVAALGFSKVTVLRDWRLARASLYRQPRGDRRDAA